MTMAARPLTPSRSRSSGSASARSVSSAIASTRPAPNSGIGTRRTMTLASARNHRLAGVAGQREQVEQRLAGRRRGRRSRRRRARRPARTSAIAARCRRSAGTLWQAAQLVPLNAGPRPSSAVSTSRKSSRPEAELLELRGVMPGSGSPGCGRRVCAIASSRGARTRRPASTIDRRRRAVLIVLARVVRRRSCRA